MLRATKKDDSHADVLASLATSQEQWRGLTLVGKAEAKKKGAVPAEKLGTILPLPAIVGAMDVIVARRLNAKAEEMTNSLGFGFLEAAKTKRQVMDIAFPAALGIERGLNRHS